MKLSQGLDCSLIHALSRLLQEAAAKPDVVVLGAATVSCLNALLAVLAHLILDKQKVFAQ